MRGIRGAGVLQRGGRVLGAFAATILIVGGCVAGAPSASSDGSGRATAPSPSAGASVSPTTSADGSVAASTVPSPSASAVATGASPDLAEVTCGTDPATSTSTPIVRPRSDGVHVRTTNATGEDRSLQIEDVGGDNAPVGVSETVWQLGPGATRIRCVDTELDAGSDVGWVSLTVVDPNALFRTTRLTCSSTTMLNNDYVEEAAGRKGDPVALTKTVIAGLRASDVVETAGYRQTPEQLVRVVRDGAVVGWLSWGKAMDGGWLLSTTALCGGTGLGMRQTE